MNANSLGLLLAMLAQTVLLPMLTALLVIGSGIKMPRRSRAEAANPALSSVGIAAGFLAAYGLGYHEQLSFPPVQRLDWLLPLTLAAVALFAYADIRSLPRRVMLGLQWAFVGVALPLLLKPMFHEWSRLQIGQALILLGVLWAGLWRYLEQVAEQSASAGVMLLVAAGGAAIAISISGSTLMGGFAAALATALAGWLILNLTRSRIPLGRSGIAVSVTLLFSLLLLAHYYASLPASNIVLILLAFAAGPLMRKIDPFRRNPSRLGTVALTGAVALVPVGIAVGLAVHDFLASSPGGY